MVLSNIFATFFVMSHAHKQFPNVTTFVCYIKANLKLFTSYIYHIKIGQICMSTQAFMIQISHNWHNELSHMNWIKLNWIASHINNYISIVYQNVSSDYSDLEYIWSLSTYGVQLYMYVVTRWVIILLIIHQIFLLCTIGHNASHDWIFPS